MSKYPFGFNLIWRLRFISCVFLFLSFFPFFFSLQPTIVDKSSVNSALVHCSRVPQITLFSNFFIKNGFYSTIYIFKNYFVTVFSVSAKISCIQTDPKSVICKNIVNGAFGVWISCWAFRFKTSVCKKVIRSCCQIEFWILKTIF